MKLDFEVTLNDYVEYKMYEIFSARISKGVLTLEKVGGVIMFALLFIMAINGGYLNKGLAIILLVVCSVPWVIFFPRLLKAVMRKRLYLRLRRKKYEGIIPALGKKTLEVEKQKIIYTSNDGREEGKSYIINNDDVYKIEEERGVLLLLTKDKGTCIIPSNAFQSREEKDKLLDAIS